MAANLEDDQIITALKHTLQHISLQQAKFKDIDLELQQKKQELEQCSQLKIQMEHLRTEMNRFKSLSEEQSTKISELEIQCVTQSQQNTVLSHQLQKKEIIIEEIKIENERNSHDLVNQLENDNKMLQQQISTLESKIELNDQQMKQVQNKNIELQHQISMLLQKEETIVQQQKKENGLFAIRLKELDDKNQTLSQQCNALQQSKNNTTNHQNVGKCSFRMLENCRSFKQLLVDTKLDMKAHQKKIKMEFDESLKKIEGLSVPSQYDHERSVKLKEAIQNKFKMVQDTKGQLNGLREEVKKELNAFDTNIKSVQRMIFKKKSMIHEQMRKEKDKSAKLTECLIENEQTMEQRLKDYLKQKDELQSKISSLEGFLNDKPQKDIVAEMKRFRSAAIVTSITSLSDDGDRGISYHELSEHERQAISIKTKFEKKINAEFDINEKVDEFIRSGGLKRYPILEQEFMYEPSDAKENRFRFGSKYICISYNVKRNELYVKNEDSGSTQLLQEWIAKNGSNEMRKLLAKISKKKKTNKQVIQPTKHPFV
eukprot:143464_1